VFYLTFTRLDGLAAGAILAVAYSRSVMEPYRRLLQAGIVVFGALMIVIGMVFRGEGLVWFAGVKYLLVTGFYTCIIATQVAGSSSFASRCLRARWLRFVGRISYGLYVFHPGVFAFCVRHLPGFPMWFRGFTGVATTFIISIASWYCFERHMLKLKDRWVPVPRPTPRALVEA
jgi:peptidoglycan/LPS O-acetylase OafA/YrhL